MSERDKFMARLSDAREAGLKDIKFFFMPVGGVREPEAIFAAMNEVEDAVRHRAVRHTGWSGNKPAGVMEVAEA